MQLRVKAKVRGFYGSLFERGEEFVIAKPSDFSHRWMVPLNFEPEPATGEPAKVFFDPGKLKGK